MSTLTFGPELQLPWDSSAAEDARYRKILRNLLSALLAWYAWPMWWESVVENAHSESLWGPPLWIPYFFLPFGLSLLFLQYIVHILYKIKILKQGVIDAAATRFELKEIEIKEAEPDKPDHE